jgi:hypothetical protein
VDGYRATALMLIAMHAQGMIAGTYGLIMIAM